MEKLEETGLTPADFGFFAEARRAVIDMGIVRRKKIDVAADLPARRVADLPVELDDDLGNSIRQAEAALAARLLDKYRRVLAAKPDGNARGPHARGGARGTRGVQGREDRRERVHHGAQDRPGEGGARRRLHGAAGAQRRQGRLLRQAHRRDGCGGGALRQGRA